MRYPLALVVIVAAGCVSDPDPLGQAQVEINVDNGTSLNGTSLNGTSLNGTSLNGTSLNGTSLNGTSLNGTSLNGTSLAGSAGRAPSGGTSAVGSTWTATIPARLTYPATTVALRIDSAEAGTGANADLWSYAVLYQTTAGWQPLCGLDQGRPIKAIPVPGVWGPAQLDLARYTASTTAFTWACRGKTIAKCVELGYKPWKGLVDHLQSCVRLLRGDFCGHGVGLTATGTLLNLYDKVGVQADTRAWKPEAAWGPNGVVCVNEANAARYELVIPFDPSCVAALRTKTCGTKFISGAYLINELP